MVYQPAGAPVACSDRSLELAEPLAGTAGTAAGFLLLEHGGPWGARSLQDRTLPGDLGSHLLHACAATGLRPLLGRRPGAVRGSPAHPTVVVAVPDGAGLVVSRQLAAPDDVRSLDLGAVTAAARVGRVPQGWVSREYLLAVCTNAGRDACCGRKGKPVALRLARLAPEHTWESTHLGGHRLAATVLALPSGVVYGRVPSRWAEHLLSAVSGGRVLVPLARGRSTLAPPLQVAELALRAHLDEDRDAAVRLLDHESEDLGAGVARTTSHWAVAAQTWRVVVDGGPGAGPDRPMGCGAESTAAPAVHTVVEVADTRSAGRGAVGWDAAHRSDVGAPHPSVVQETADLAPATALDLACGTGRHALWLAARGWRVTAVDFSRNGIAVGAREADARGVEIDWQLADVRLWTPPHDGYDLVLMTYVHLPEVLPRALMWVRPGGRVVIVGHALRNATEGVGGPTDPRLLHDVVDLAARVTGARLRVVRAAEVERPVEAGTAIDAVLVATRLPARSPWGR